MMLEIIAPIFLAGRPGARLTGLLHRQAGPNTLLRRIRALPTNAPQTSPRLLDMDGFTFRRGHVYGTVLTGIETGRCVGVLPDRTGKDFTAWLRQHPEPKPWHRPPRGRRRLGSLKRPGPPADDGCTQPLVAAEALGRTPMTATTAPTTHSTPATEAAVCTPFMNA